jgi:hypothetical protein
MKIKSKLEIIAVLSMICLCILSAFTPAVTARDSFAPSWLKEGVYITYICKDENVAYVFDVADPRFEGLNYLYAPSFDMITYSNASLTWRCVSVNATMAKLQVTFNYVGKTLDHNTGAEWIKTPLNGESFQRTGDVYVDLYTRAVYNSNGVLLGTTHLWLPANPSEGQEITVWDAPPKIITIPVTMNPSYETIQGTQDAFMFSDGNFKLNDTQTSVATMILLVYDLDTGLAVDGVFSWDPIMAAIGIGESGLIGDGQPNTALFETNIDFGPERTSINWMQILQYSILPIAIVLLIAAFIVRSKKKKK